MSTSDLGRELCEQIVAELSGTADAPVIVKPRFNHAASPIALLLEPLPIWCVELAPTLDGVTITALDGFPLPLSQSQISYPVMWNVAEDEARPAIFAPEFRTTVLEATLAAASTVAAKRAEQNADR